MSGPPSEKDAGTRDRAWVFRCQACGEAFRLRNSFEDPTTSTGCCRLCGSRDWHIYAKDDQGRVHIVD